MRMSLRDFGRMWAETIKNRMDQDYMTTIIITGEKGSGKSLIGHSICKAMQELYGHDLEAGFVPPLPITKLTKQEADRLASYLDENVLRNKNVQVVFFDEAIDVLYSKETMHKPYKKLIKILRKIRKKKKNFIFNVPHFSDIGTDIRKRDFNFWIHIPFKINKKWNLAVVLRGYDPAREFEFDIEHIYYQLEKYGPLGWFKNKYFLFARKVEYDPEIDKEYKRLFEKKEKELESWISEDNKKKKIILKKNTQNNHLAP